MPLKIKASLRFYLFLLHFHFILITLFRSFPPAHLSFMSLSIISPLPTSLPPTPLPYHPPPSPFLLPTTPTSLSHSPISSSTPCHLTHSMSSISPVLLLVNYPTSSSLSFDSRSPSNSSNSASPLSIRFHHFNATLSSSPNS